MPIVTTREAYISCPTSLKLIIQKTLSEIDRPSTFACGERLDDGANPGLLLKGHGLLGMPLSDNDARAIISQSRQSRFGRGSETVVDTSISDSWQLDPDQFQIRNGSWGSFILRLVAKVHAGFGLKCQKDRVSAELYKLLLYQRGAFFRPHSDSEIAPCMFGTLTVCLPCAHEGGELVFSHNGKSFSFKTSESSDFDMSYAAWCADVLHEVKPVTSGHRLVLIYNLIHQSQVVTDLPSASVFNSEQTRLVKGFRGWDPPRYPQPEYLIHKLAHQYSQASLRADRLKGADLAQLSFLREVAAETGIDLYLANMEKHATKSDERWARNQVLSVDIVLTYVVTLDGSRVDHPNRTVYIKSNNLIDTTDGQHYKEDHRGFTGNEGATAEYWYSGTVFCNIGPSTEMEI
ncbi:hypothetical protein H2200_000700 [Cladophialophora chaetospira]|uniref:Fe2OG dioxygenase domain-containing protein n=1 Tax=Cladophialophora chaetospira TaxID=386627 RepID=A0AA38XQ02_9EURO|nr:hypothetical protein H2200_000700 [Cladophialophora chaetospira]